MKAPSAKREPVVRFGALSEDLPSYSMAEAEAEVERLTKETNEVLSTARLNPKAILGSVQPASLTRSFHPTMTVEGSPRFFGRSGPLRGGGARFSARESIFVTWFSRLRLSGTGFRPPPGPGH